MALYALDALGVTLLSRGSKKVSKKREVPLTFGSLFEPFLGPWGHLESIWEVRDLKKDDSGSDSFLDHIFASKLNHQHVQKSVLVQVSARFSLFH